MKQIAAVLLAAAWIFSAIPTADTVTNSVGMKFKRIPAGTFDMGFEGRALTGSVIYGGITQGFYNEHPKHKVTLTQDFYMGLYEVTNTQFKLFRPTHGNNIPWYPGGATVPATRLTWFAADSFCEWLTANDPNGWTYRLPTEAEWEYCCRAGTDTWFSTGDSISTADAAIVEGWGGVVAPGNVGRYTPNPWGLYDMHGNAEEWCLDWLGMYRADSLVNPGGRLDGRVKTFRSLGHYRIFVRNVARGGLPPVTSASGRVSFRVVISALTKDLLNYLPAEDSLRPYQRNVSASRPAPLTAVSGETYTDNDGIAFKRVRMTRERYPSQKDSVVYVSLDAISGDSALSRELAGAYARRLSETYGVLYRLSNRYELSDGNIGALAGEYHLTLLPDIKYAAGAPHPNVTYMKARNTATIPTPVPVVGGPVYYNVNHNSFIGEAPNGDLINDWYSGTSEDNEEQVMAGSRLRLGEDAWDSVTSQIEDFPGYVDYASVFWDNGRGVLYNYHSIGNPTWLRKSMDNGVTWSPWQNAFPSLVGKSIFRLGGDSLVDITDGSGLLVLSTDYGETWTLGSSGAGGGYHSSGIVTDQGVIVAFQRGATVNNDSGATTMLKASTSNLGQTWTRTASPFWPPSIGQYDVVLKLQSGRLLLAGVCRAPSKGGVILAESEDQGATWFCRRKLGSTNLVDRMAGYKDMCQTRDGIIHLQGTEGSAGGLNGHLPQISFTEEWLREGTCLDIADWGIPTAGMVATDCPDEDTLYYTGAAGRVGAATRAAPTLAAAPNPFNPATRITVAGAKAGTRVMVYDLNGRLAACLPLHRGAALWDASGKPSGLYLVEFSDGDRTSTKRIMLIK